MIIGIMACAKNGVIGRNGKIPWRYEGDLSFFQKITNDKTMIMGRKTFDEISDSNLFKNRRGIIFTRNKTHSKNRNIKFVNSVREVKIEDEMYMIGGAEITTLFIQEGMIGKFLLTRINKSYEGDVYFPISMINDWKKKIIKNCDEYNIWEYYR